MGTHSHKKGAPKTARIGIISVSTTRTLSDDKSGHWIKKRGKKEGHEVALHVVVPDEASSIKSMVLKAVKELDIEVLLITGGTGISPKDVTIEAVRPLFTKELTAFGAIFAQLSYEQIDSAAILSRATAGIVENTIVFCMPGSIKACKMACKALIYPEIGHLVKHVSEN